MNFMKWQVQVKMGFNDGGASGSIFKKTAFLN